jgi:hypothetical protein
MWPVSVVCIVRSLPKNVSFQDLTESDIKAVEIQAIQRHLPAVITLVTRPGGKTGFKICLWKIIWPKKERQWLKYLVYSLLHKIKVKVKSLCLTKHHAIKTYWGSGGEWSDSNTGRFTAGTSWIVGWMGPRTGMDSVAMRKNPIIAPTGNWTTVFQPEA